jgi:FHA domain-containing protein/von Willebrand factor type A domain-containing protein
MKTRASRTGLALLSATCLLLPIGRALAQEPPAIIALTIDTSGSIRPELLDQIKQLASGVLGKLPPGSEVAVFSFNDQSTRILERTNSGAAVEQAVQGLQRAGRFTALYDALYDASRYLKEAPPARKAIILVTDGKDENSSVQIEDGLKIAVENRIPVHCVGVGRIQEAVLRRIARLTTGEYAPIDAGPSDLIAQRISELPAPATAPPPPIAAPVAATPVAASVPARNNTWLYVLVGSLVVAAAFGAAYFLRSRPRPEDAEIGEGTVAVHDPDESADSTVVMRAPEAGQVERTVMLRLQPSLTVTRGPGQGEVFNLSLESAVSIGRAPTNDIPLGDSAVSGEHCRIRPEGGAFVLHDLKSTNGTFVNEKRIERHRLSEGDVIRVGETHFRFGMGPA